MNWNDLTMAQKNELMQTYIRNGVTSLDDMRSHFNSFAAGGPKDPPTVLPVNEEGIPYYTLSDVDVVAEALPKAKATDTNIQRYANAVANGQIKLTQIPNTELRNRVRAVPIMDQWYKDMDKSAKKVGLPLLGLAATPMLLGAAEGAIPATIGTIMNNPIVDAGLTIHGAVTAPKNIKEGVQELQEGNYGRGALDLGLTALDLYGAGKLVNHSKNATKRLAEVFVRQGDALHDMTPQSAINLLKKKETKDYVLKGGRHPELAYRTGNYSGNTMPGNGDLPHEGDVIDAFFGKPRSKEEYVKELSIEDLSPEMQRYIQKNYKRKQGKIKVFDLGEVKDAANINDTDSWGLFKDIELPNQEDVKALGLKPLTEERYVLDPGGYHHVENILENDKVRHFNEDIWKYKAKDYKNRRSSVFNSPHKLNATLKDLGLRFIDTMGTPVVHTWSVDTPVTLDAMLNNFKVIKDNNIDTSHIDELIDFFNN